MKLLYVTLNIKYMVIYAVKMVLAYVDLSYLNGFKLWGHFNLDTVYTGWAK